MPDRRLNEEEIFHVARKITEPETQAKYLDQICAGDQPLRERVEALLKVHEQPEGFLAPEAEPGVTADQPSIAEMPGHEIGRYKLLQKIGEGGFGVVYMAEQQRPVHRRVALKIIKPGMDTHAVVARFEAERQALALMDHANIARVFDGGTTETGRPYFVMELVKGVPITEYCDENQLSTDERLRLFITICQAVQHAHQKGIIHRDLKPSNILVTLHDGRPVIKIIDFGVAKAINQQLTEKTLFTSYGQMIGTPQYMSPEQAEMSGLDVDTRSDIYSLGVLLYELLTGTTPLEADRLRAAGYAEMQRMIKEEEPPKPSTRLSSAGDELTIVAKHRSISPERLSALVKGDLDWIVMKSLEKDRSRRYLTPHDFAEDITRFLEDQPVLACPPSTVYRLRKVAARHRLALAAAATVIIVLLAGVVTSTVFAIQMYKERQEARRQREAAVAAQAEADRQRVSAENAQEQAETIAGRLQDTLRQFQHELLDHAFSLALAGDVAEVEAALSKARDAAADDDVIRTIRGIAYRCSGDQQKAIALLKEVLEDHPDSLAALCALHLAGMGASSYEEMNTLHERLGRAEKTAGISDHARLLLAETKLFGTMDLPRLVQDVDAIIQRHPRWGIAFAVRSMVKVQLGATTMSMDRLQDAAADADTARRLLPDNPYPLVASLNAYNYLLQLATHEGLDTAELKLRAGNFADELERWPNLMPGNFSRLVYFHLSQQDQKLQSERQRLLARGYGSPQPELADLLQRDDPSELLAFAARDPSQATPKIAVAIRHVLDGDSEAAFKILEELEQGEAPTNTRCLALDIPSIAQRPDLMKRSAERILARLPEHDPPSLWRFEVWEAQYVAGFMDEDELIRRAGPFHMEGAAVHWLVGMKALSHGDTSKAGRHLEIAAAFADPGAWGTVFSRAYLNLMDKGRIPVHAKTSPGNRDAPPSQ